MFLFIKGCEQWKKMSNLCDKKTSVVLKNKRPKLLIKTEFKCTEGKSANMQ